jgi:outer membrane protein
VGVAHLTFGISLFPVIEYLLIKRTAFTENSLGDQYMSTLKMVLLVAVLALGYTSNANAREAGDWIVRAGVSYIDPDSSNGTLDGTDIAVEVDSATMLTFDVTYMMTQNWAIELLAAAPFKHDIGLQGIGKVGSAKQLPPTLSLQYHFNKMGKFQPYLGAGVNWTLFFDEKTTGALDGSDLSLKNSIGFAAQAGFDMELTDKLYFNASLRYMDIDTEAKVDGIKVANVHIDPWVYALNLGYRL